ncbi:MAG TPA: hypothetical protein VM779_09515 [Thermoanaerobaculia bacterium]|nr:hypothetical protein [Thermoanaerobaculia bacterium]
MQFKRSIILQLLAVVCPGPAVVAQSSWDSGYRVEIRAGYRDSDQERFQLRFPFPPAFLPVGQSAGWLETVDPGQHFELSVASLQLDARYGRWFHARAKVHAIDKYRRNPTSSDRKSDIDELFLVVGDMPEFLERPEGTSLFALAGKSPRMERQPVRLLESYGLAANSFNRFEDVQAIVGGTIGRNFYWRVQAANGNPLYFRDANALAGDNGIPELREPNPDPDLKSGFPILYNAETEDLFFKTDSLQLGQAIGYRWATEDQSSGFDIIVFHYRRDLDDTAELTGTFYGADLDLLDAFGDGGGLPLEGRNKEEYGARLYGELRGLTAIVQYTRQEVAGLDRAAWEVEAGYRIALPWSVAHSIQPAVRFSDLTNDFAGDPLRHPAPSIWWDWRKLDYGLRIGLAGNVDVTFERSTHDVEAPRELDLDETLVTLRWRM